MYATAGCLECPHLTPMGVSFWVPPISLSHNCHYLHLTSVQLLTLKKHQQLAGFRSCLALCGGLLTHLYYRSVYF